MTYLRNNGYLLAEKAKKHQWNQTLYYALSALAVKVFQEIEAHNESVPMDTPHSSGESAVQGTPLCPDSDVDLPSRANDINALPNPLPCNEMIPSPAFPVPIASSEDVPRDAFRERLEVWSITESEIRDFLHRTDCSEAWVYQWLGIMLEDIRLGHVKEYRSPIGALMKRHKENWPLPRAVRSADLPEAKKLQKAVDTARCKMMEEFESIKLDPASPFFRIHMNNRVPPIAT